MSMAIAVVAQDKKAIKYANTITSDDLEKHLTILASDEYEGRETGKKGQKMAAKYIAKHFEKLGLKGPVNGSHFQTFNLTESMLSTSYFRRGDEKKLAFEDFIYYSSSETSGEEHVTIILADDDDSMIEQYEGSYVTYLVDALGGLQPRINKAKEKGAKGFIVIIKSDDEFNSTMKRFTPYLKRAKLSINSRNNDNDKMIIISKALASWIFEKNLESIKPGDKTKIIFNSDYLDQPVSTENVLGYLEGTEKPNELLIITSHYDHVGIIDGKIHNGADDDGSGTVTVLELAEAFATAATKKNGPKRSILFMTVTGEEKGLLGSQYYTDTEPVFPLENTVANLNIDMVGRIDEKHTENPDYVYLIGADKLSHELHTLSENVNKTYTNLELDYTYNDENDPNRFYYRSDHYNFAKNHIPIIFYFNGTHPDYHQPTDTIEKIDFETMQKRARLIFHTGWELANKKERIKVDDQ